MQRDKFTYKYRNRISVPSLTMIDEILTISKCGIDSIESNAYINSKIEMKKLTLNTDKCKKIHVGKNEKYCHTLYSHDKEMKSSSQEKYIGDIISRDGNNTKNIKYKAGVGISANSKIMNILREVHVGSHYFRVGIILRQAILISSMLLNFDSYLKITQENLNLLKQVNENILRRILGAYKSTPKPSLYLETGTIPVSFIIKGKRILYLHYLLNQPPKSLLFKMLQD